MNYKSKCVQFPFSKLPDKLLSGIDYTKDPTTKFEVDKEKHEIRKRTIKVNGEDSNDVNLSGDTTVQEKNITYPTDDKLYKKIIKKCRAIADEEQIELRQSYTQTIKKLSNI